MNAAKTGHVRIFKYCGSTSLRILDAFSGWYRLRQDLIALYVESPTPHFYILTSTVGLTNLPTIFQQISVHFFFSQESRKINTVITVTWSFYNPGDCLPTLAPMSSIHCQDISYNSAQIVWLHCLYLWGLGAHFSGETRTHSASNRGKSELPPKLFFQNSISNSNSQFPEYP